ncbi:MAG: hypothetical protein ABR958_00435 [Dehalococcoidales bacterium]
MDAALIIGVIALIVATPSAIQMFWGKPKIIFRFYTRDIEEHTILSCDIQNKPIEDSILKALGVYRRSVVISATLQIFEEGTNRPFLNEYMPDFFTYSEIRGARITLDSSVIPVTIDIISARKKDGKVVRDEDELRDNLPSIPIGTYKVRVTLTADSDYITMFHSFYVSDKYPYANWL